MNPLDYIILKILGLNTKEINTWMKNKNIHTLESYRKIDEKWIKSSHQNKKKIKEIELEEKKIKNPKEYLKKLKKLLRAQEIFKKEWNKGQIQFDSFSDFKKFSLWLSIFHMGYFKLTLKNIKHEKEHAQIYEKAGIKHQFGWVKLMDKKRKKYKYTPFVRARAPGKIHLKSIKNVSKLSEGDILSKKEYN